jgi:hypothetical protein
MRMTREDLLNFYSQHINTGTSLERVQEDEEELLYFMQNHADVTPIAKDEYEASFYD